MLRPVIPAETSALIDLAVATGLFTPEDAESLLGGVLADLHAGRLGDGHQACAWIDDASGALAGWAYYAPTPKADGVWDLWWIGVDPRYQRSGAGSGLLGAIESAVRNAGGRLLVIETSALPALAGTRQFYSKRGYAECGRVPDFYGVGDDKVIFAKRLADG